MLRISDALPVGAPIPESAQIGRGPLIKSLEGRLSEANVVTLVEPRRMGKTSVARAALKRIKDSGGIVGEVNLAACRDCDAAAAVLADQIAYGLARPARRAAELLRHLRGVEIPQAEDAGIAVAVAQLFGPSPTFDQVLFEAPNRARGRPVAVLLDEAYAIADWPAASQRALNVVLRDNNQLGVVVVSSRRREIREVLGKDGALDLVGYPLPIPPIDIDTWCSGLRQRFLRLAIQVDRMALRRLVAEAHGHPYCTMRLAVESARLAREYCAITGSSQASLTDIILTAALITVDSDPVWQQVIK